MQEFFLSKLKEALPANTSLIDTVAEVLDISYDAAHRRTSLKSKLSLEEAIKLSRHFNMSIDQLYEIGLQNVIAVEKTQMITSQAELQAYFEASYENLKQILAIKDSEIIYSAKDLPIFYTSSDNILSRFKMYVWLQLLGDEQKVGAFENFAPSVSLVSAASRLGELYANLKVTEIWDVTTINSTLKQIHFYYKSTLLTETIALKLCEDIKQLIAMIEEKVANEPQYRLFYNELLLMNNTVLVKTPIIKTLFVPYTILSYYKTSDTKTLTQVDEHLQRQMRNSKLLSTAGKKEQRIFFNKMYKKIDALMYLIQAENVLDFE
ncbi:hypothetical protein U8527_05765 [Kordia algicida OT-1]|uniref:HTH cro/C1-type domain-containing protein n=1 Tax=Kordia algicida OT-1 TaxID=391587 RepID=A9E253_9FLAO|nr:hypothetical protein [Kordia algicida]EDP95529.1 hypothetical protein KAOT1_21796 [Kordia algicida OT-1]